VVVTGLGALTPIGNSVEEYWKGLINGVSGAGPITRFDVTKFKRGLPAKSKVSTRKIILTGKKSANMIFTAISD